MIHPQQLGVQKSIKYRIKILIIDMLYVNISKPTHITHTNVHINLWVQACFFCSLALAGFLQQNINLQSQFSPCPLLSPLPHASYSNKWIAASSKWISEFCAWSASFSILSLWARGRRKKRLCGVNQTHPHIHPLHPITKDVSSAQPPPPPPPPTPLTSRAVSEFKEKLCLVLSWDLQFSSPHKKIPQTLEITTMHNLSAAPDWGHFSATTEELLSHGAALQWDVLSHQWSKLHSCICAY